MAARDNPYFIAPPNIYDALLSGVGGYDKAQKSVQDAERDAVLRQVGQEIAQGGISDSSLGKLFGIRAGEGVPSLNAAAHLMAAKQQGQGFYGTPIWGIDPDTGRAGVGTFNKQGKFMLIDTGNFQVTPGVKTIDTGTGTAVVSNKTGLPVGGQSGTTQIPPTVGGQPATPGYIPKDIQGEATQKETGKEVGERAANLGKAKSAVDTGINALDRLEFTANRIKNDPALGRITGIPGVFPNLPGGGAANVQAQLETLKSQAAFTVLQAMREASKTGGAIGQVSNFEEQMLMNNLAAVDRAQSKGEFQKAMGLIVDYARGAKQRLQSAYDRDYAGIQKPQQTVPITPQGQPPQLPQQGQGVRVPQNLTPAGLANWARANRIPSGTPLTLPDGSTIYAP